MAIRQATLTAARCGFVLLGSGGPAASAMQGRSGEDRVAIADFNRRVQAYVELHRRIEGRFRQSRSRPIPARSGRRFTSSGTLSALNGSTRGRATS